MITHRASSPLLLRSCQVVSDQQPLPNQISSPATTAPLPTPLTVHHITGQTTLASIDGIPFFCPLYCDSCNCPGYRRIPDPDCLCNHCTTLTNTMPITVDDLLIQRHCLLSDTTNINLDEL
ncbi:hypothetical protein BOTBODRAFT_174098 [Botryobasidium botryosum FD-172 SS1]|uniref:Uncharacterized protein n=1 Tax=Botryobasidium botryosum (strain FD-172 SS1) TaxID=930990 RepID=A0A067MUI3_BOTB1|nr:hypothetical protein BOTBODRAFT_174098 [Botryobasidium botryosum FD-172 SS1]